MLELDSVTSLSTAELSQALFNGTNRSIDALRTAFTSRLTGVRLKVSLYHLASYAIWELEMTATRSIEIQQD